MQQCKLSQAVKIKKKLREKAEEDTLIPKKEPDFYRDHIDVIMRENYISSDSEEEELARKIKTARLNTTRANTARNGTLGRNTGLSRSSTVASPDKSSNNSSNLKLPAIKA